MPNGYIKCFFYIFSSKHILKASNSAPKGAQRDSSQPLYLISVGQPKAHSDITHLFPYLKLSSDEMCGTCNTSIFPNDLEICEASNS